MARCLPPVAGAKARQSRVPFRTMVSMRVSWLRLSLAPAALARVFLAGLKPWPNKVHGLEPPRTVPRAHHLPVGLVLYLKLGVVFAWCGGHFLRFMGVKDAPLWTGTVAPDEIFGFGRKHHQKDSVSLFNFNSGTSCVWDQVGALGRGCLASQSGADRDALAIRRTSPQSGSGSLDVRQTMQIVAEVNKMLREQADCFVLRYDESGMFTGKLAKMLRSSRGFNSFIFKRLDKYLELPSKIPRLLWTPLSA